MSELLNRIALRIKKVDEEASLWDKIQEYVLDIYDGLITMDEAEEELTEEEFGLLLEEILGNGTP